MEKRGELTTNEFLELILAVAGVILVGLFFYNLISPNWNSEEKTSEAYLSSLSEQIQIADDGGTGEFFIWSVEDEESIEYFLVYFGGKSTWNFGDKSFFSGGDNKNHICVCSSRGEKIECNACEDLSFPVKFEPLLPTENWFISKGERVAISKKEDNYEFRKIE